MNLKPLERQGDNNALHKRVIEGNIEAVRKLVDSDARTGDHKFNYLAACDLSIKVRGTRRYVCQHQTKDSLSVEIPSRTLSNVSEGQK